VSVTAREDVPHFGPKLPNPAIFKKVCHCDVARFFRSNIFSNPHCLSFLVSSFIPLLKPNVELPVMMSIIWSFVGPWISQVLVDQTDKCRAVSLQQCRVRQISGESNNILILLSTRTPFTCYLFFVYLFFQDRTRSTLLRGLAKDLLEKNALILDAVGEEVVRL